MVHTVPDSVRSVGPPQVKGDAPASRRIPVRPESVGGDAVELSSAAKAGLAPEENAPIRVELVERVRKEIADGTYMTEDKLSKALDRLIDRALSQV
jgi:anti-sigma28 factor (negative regulator of flagellin synthesis)